MHYVTVALDHHDIGKLDRAELRDTAHVVAAQVHQHHMFGPFLGIGEQLFGQSLVFLLGAAAAASACQWSNRHLTLDYAH